ncbi:MAG: hypothetical protein ACYTDT_11740 [Planctomycetota bacterium]
MYRHILAALVLATSLAACGGGANNAPPASPDTPYQGSGSGTDNSSCSGDDAPTDPPDDPTAWKKVDHSPPSGWSKLNKDATSEIEAKLAPKLKSAKFVACHGSRKPPHPSSGTEDEWATWLEGINIGTLYFVADEKDAAAVLKNNGAKLIEKLGADVSGNAKSASAKSGRVLVEARSTKYGTFVLVGVATTDHASEKLGNWANSIKE